jgi:hypothetical protein
MRSNDKRASLMDRYENVGGAGWSIGGVGRPSPYDSQDTAQSPDKGTHPGAGIPPFGLGHLDMAMARPL